MLCYVVLYFFYMLLCKVVVLCLDYVMFALCNVMLHAVPGLCYVLHLCYVMLCLGFVMLYYSMLLYITLC